MDTNSLIPVVFLNSISKSVSPLVKSCVTTIHNILYTKVKIIEGRTILHGRVKLNKIKIKSICLKRFYYIQKFYFSVPGNRFSTFGTH